MCSVKFQGEGKVRKEALFTGLVVIVFMLWSGGAASDTHSEQLALARLEVSRVEASPHVRVGTKTSSPSKQLTQAEYRGELARLESFVLAKDLSSLTAAGDSAERSWGSAGGEFYGLLMLEISNLISNYFSDFPVSQKYSIQALSRANTFSLRLETRLLGFLTRDLYSNNSRQKWATERSAKAKLWLHAWRRLDHEINRSFDFNDRPYLNLTPSEETGLPSGVSPEAIRDAQLRAKYQTALAANDKKTREYSRQFELRYLDETFPKRAGEYLARVYSEPPFNVAELRRYLTTYGLNQPTKTRLLVEVAKRISEGK